MDDNVSSLLVPELAKSCEEGVDSTSFVLRVRCHAEKADPVVFPGRLATRRERARHRAAEKQYELASM